MAKKSTKTSTKKDKKDVLKKKPLIKVIKDDKYYDSEPKDRDQAERRLIERAIKPTSIKDAFIGQLCYFNYYSPKTKEDLEYYDAKPVVLVFGKFRTKEGEPRILGFNIHYYPPRIRYNVLDKIFTIYKRIYIEDKVYESGLTKDMTEMQYKELLDQLYKAKLDFGVRDYIPNLIRQMRVIPTKEFPKAILTEGMFKKKTREAILRYWSTFRSSAKVPPPKKKQD